MGKTEKELATVEATKESNPTDIQKAKVEPVKGTSNPTDIQKVKVEPAKGTSNPTDIQKVNENPNDNAKDGNLQENAEQNISFGTEEAIAAEEEKVAAKEDEKDKDKDKKGKKEKELTPEQLAEQLAKQLEAEKQERKRIARELKYKAGIENDIELQRKQRTERKVIQKSIITNGAVLLGGVGASVALMLLVTPFLIGLALPIAGVTGFNLFKAIKKRLPQLNNPYELRKMLIIEQAQKEHNLRNQKIIEAYKAEKKRIKALKGLPYKILNMVTFMISMFTIIFVFFLLDLGIKVTALVLFAIFTIIYFVIGSIMVGVFYLISENRQRTLAMQLEEAKNRLLVEEQIRSENSVRKKLEAERRRYEEEERLRIEEQIRLQAEMEAAAELQRLKEEEERRIKEAKEAKEAAKAAERERLMQELRDRKQVVKHIIPPAPPTRAEIAKEAETLKNEFDKKILEGIDTSLDDLNISGIERFTTAEKLAIEYAPGLVFPDTDASLETIESEVDNTILEAPDVRLSEEEEKIPAFEGTIATEKVIIEDNGGMQKTPPPPSSPKEDETLKKAMLSEIGEKAEPPAKQVSGKSISVLKQMLKDG